MSKSMNITVEQAKKTSAVLIYVSLPLVLIGAGLHLWNNNWVTAGAEVALASSFLALKVVMHSLAEAHEGRMVNSRFVTEANESDARRALANAKVSELVLASMERHAASGGGFSVGGEIEVGPIKRSH